MLKLLRKKGVMKILLWAVAVLIILVFGLMGKVSLLGNDQQVSYAGVIFDKKISINEFQHHYQQVLLKDFLKYGNNIFKLKEFLNLEGRTWDRVILAHEANKRKIKIRNEDVIKTIQNTNLFQNESNQFSNDQYNLMLKNLRMSPREYEEGIRDELKFFQLFEQVTLPITVPESDLWESYKAKNEKVQISYILFSAEQFKNQVSENPDAEKEYYTQNKEEFTMPPAVNIEFIRIDYPQDIQEKIALKQKNELEETPQDLDPSLDKDIKKAQDAAWDKAYSLAEEINKSDFKTIAEAHKLPIQTSGFFSMEQPKLEEGWSFDLIQELFQQKSGYTTEPISTPSGFQILRITEHRGQFIPDYEQAKEKVKEKWTEIKAKEIAKENGEKSLAMIQKIFDHLKRPDFSQIAKENNFEIHQTPIFTRGQYLPELGIAKDFQETAFTLSEENKLSALVETTKGHCILHLDTIIAAEKKDFEKNKEAFSEEILQEKKMYAFNEFVTLLRQKANLIDHISKQKQEE